MFLLLLAPTIRVIRVQLVLEIVIVFDRRYCAHAWNFVVDVAVSKVKITVDDGCDGGRNTVTASTVAITVATTAIALRNVDAVAVGGRS